MTRATLLGNIHTVDGKVLCVFHEDGHTELVLATGKLATVDRWNAARLGEILRTASALKNATDITHGATLPGKPPLRRV